MGVTDWFDWLASVVIISSIVVGFVEVGSGLGSVSEMVQRMVNEPKTFGLGLVIFYIGYDTWIPAIPKSFLDQYGLGWLTWFYPFAEGFIPTYSMWTFIFAIVFTTIATWITLELLDWDFWFKGLGLVVLYFIIGWYSWTLIAWQLMYLGGAMIGLSGETVHKLWLSSVTATKTPVLQYFFLFTIPLSIIYIGKRIGGWII
jgi:hypothetical protein